MNQSLDVASQMMAFYRKTASKRGGGGWRTIGKMAGCSGAYARQLAMGKKPMTLEIAGEWLASIGDVPRRYEVEACPDCGNVHTGRCNGKPVVEVVTLAPGEVVKRAKPPRQPSPELTRIMQAFCKLTPQPVTGGCYDRRGARKGNVWP